MFQTEPQPQTLKPCSWGAGPAADGGSSSPGRKLGSDKKLHDLLALRFGSSISRQLRSPSLRHVQGNRKPLRPRERQIAALMKQSLVPQTTLSYRSLSL